jgi:alkylation response protein AidB-like acyl-CoA dehydrogenase
VNFDLNEEESMLRALAERFVGDRYDIERRRGYLADAMGFDGNNWDLLAQTGLLAAGLDEADGGLGLGPAAIATLFAALGRGLVVEPLVDAVLIGARLLLAGAPAALAESWRDDLAGGRRRVALAHVERGWRGAEETVRTGAAPAPGGWQLNGGKVCVPAGVGADAYIVSAHTGGDGLGLFVVPADSPGLAARAWRTIDGGAAVTLDLVDVPVPATHVLADGTALLDAVTPLAELARAAEAVGIMERLFDDTLEYLRVRNQFNTPLGRFQAIQHRMVGHYAALEQSKALINHALISADGQGFAAAVRGLRAFVSEVSIPLGHDMIQFHGGMGVTDELAIGHGHKRLVFLSRWPNDPLAKLDAYAAMAA